MSMHRATVTVTLPNASTVGRALRPEAGRDVPGARVRVSAGRSLLTIVAEAEDTGALRAALNSYLRWTDVAVNVAEAARA